MDGIVAFLVWLFGWKMRNISGTPKIVSLYGWKEARKYVNVAKNDKIVNSSVIGVCLWWAVTLCWPLGLSVFLENGLIWSDITKIIRKLWYLLSIAVLQWEAENICVKKRTSSGQVWLECLPASTGYTQCITVEKMPWTGVTAAEANMPNASKAFIWNMMEIITNSTVLPA